jgi:hypothetical protein
MEKCGPLGPRRPWATRALTLFRVAGCNGGRGRGRRGFGVVLSPGSPDVCDGPGAVLGSHWGPALASSTPCLELRYPAWRRRRGEVRLVCASQSSGSLARMSHASRLAAWRPNPCSPPPNPNPKAPGYGIGGPTCTTPQTTSAAAPPRPRRRCGPLCGRCCAAAPSTRARRCWRCGRPPSSTSAAGAAELTQRNLGQSQDYCRLAAQTPRTAPLDVI